MINVTSIEQALDFIANCYYQYKQTEGATKVINPTGYF